MKRRSFVKGAVALPVGLAACGGSGTTTPNTDVQATFWTPSELPEDSERYPLGVQAGAMTASGAYVWGYSAAGGSRRFVLWTDMEIVADVVVTDTEGYYKELISGLSPNTVYHYVLQDDASKETATRSLVGRFQTAFGENTVEAVTLGATACTHYWNLPYESLKVAAKYPMHAFIHVGDMSYNDQATTREEYRELWHKTLQDPGYRALLPTVGTYLTWDDHEIANDSERDTITPEHWQAGADAWFETLPVPRGANNRLWGNYRWGQSVEIFVLDCRSERQPETMETDAAIYISQEQMDWLKDGLLNSSAAFKVIANSVPIAELTESWPAVDTWTGYASQRTELLDHIVDNDIQGVWFLSGDYHLGSSHSVAREGKYAGIREVMVGPGASSPNPLIGAIQLSPGLAESIVPADQFDYYSIDYAATRITFDPEANTVHVQFISAADESILFEKTYEG